jgi:fatty-acyl-CoA synthase
VPRGERGELCTRGYSVMHGYWGDEAKTREAIDAEAGCTPATWPPWTPRAT